MGITKMQTIDIDPVRFKDQNFVKKVARSIFTEADKDNSGSIDREELILFMNEYSTALDQRIPNEDEIDQIIKAFDKDRDGLLSFREFTCLVKSMFDQIFDIV